MSKTTLIGMVLLLLISGQQTWADIAPWEGDPMVVDGDMIDGDNILCRGSGCATVLDSLYRDYLYDLMYLLDRPNLIDDDGVPEFRVAQSEFCKRLEEKRPPGCSKSSPPAVPGIDPSWRPNGCGVGDWRDAALSIIARLGIKHFTGDLDAPFPGVSFLGACNAHDRCYGYQAGKLHCDGNFRNAMRGACDRSTSGNAREICYASVSAYHAAVVGYGDGAYEEAGSNLACARWHLDMRTNGCRS